MIEITHIDQTKEYAISTRLLMQEALRKGYTLSYFPSAPMTGSGITLAQKKGREVYFKSTSTALTPSFGFFSAEDKALTFSLLSSRGINTPDTFVLAVDQPTSVAEDFVKKYDQIVVKPVRMNHGDGITVGVSGIQKLEEARKYANKAFGSDTDVLVQQQVGGNEYRFLVVEGRVVAVAGRRAPFVVGDGKSTVEQLIEKKNRDPRRGDGHESELTRINIDDVVHHRGKAFLNVVPAVGEELSVLDTTNLSRGGEAVDYTDVASPAIKKLAADAADACFLGVAGVDIMTNDIESESIDDSYVIEVNLTPGIRMHQFPSIGKGRDVAKIIFRAIEKTSRPIGRKVKRIGRSEKIELKGIFEGKIPARIDTGATLSSIWASDIKVDNKTLSFKLFDKSSNLYTGNDVYMSDFGMRTISTSTGQLEERYVVKMSVKIGRKVIKARFTLADRSTQAYPVLIGRNVLRNNFIVDVYDDKGADRRAEQAKRNKIDKARK